MSMDKKINDIIKNFIWEDTKKLKEVSKKALKNDDISSIINSYKKWKIGDIIYTQNNYYELNFLNCLTKKDADTKILLNNILYYFEYYALFKQHFNNFTLSIIIDYEPDWEELYIFPGIFYNINDLPFNYRWVIIRQNNYIEYISSIFKELWIWWYFDIFVVNYNNNEILYIEFLDIEKRKTKSVRFD